MELLGLAVGAVGMTIADFAQLTPEELHAILEAWHTHHPREGWEQTRLLAAATLQPWSKKALRPTDICPLPWDNRHLPSGQKNTARRSTRERFDEIRRRLANSE